MEKPNSQPNNIAERQLELARKILAGTETPEEREEAKNVPPETRNPHSHILPEIKNKRVQEQMIREAKLRARGDPKD